MPKPSGRQQHGHAHTQAKAPFCDLFNAFFTRPRRERANKCFKLLTGVAVMYQDASRTTLGGGMTTTFVLITGAWHGGWDRFAQRLGVSPILTPGSHEACFTQPASLAEALVKA
jgi:hypothetical protein